MYDVLAGQHGSLSLARYSPGARTPKGYRNVGSETFGRHGTKVPVNRLQDERMSPPQSVVLPYPGVPSEPVPVAILARTFALALQDPVASVRRQIRACENL